jgi:hypothetical protein
MEGYEYFKDMQWLSSDGPTDRLEVETQENTFLYSTHNRASHHWSANSAGAIV